MSARREQLVSELAEYGIVITTEQADLLVSYLQLVTEKNKVVNLTRITDRWTRGRQGKEARQ